MIYILSAIAVVALVIVAVATRPAWRAHKRHQRWERFIRTIARFNATLRGVGNAAEEAAEAMKHFGEISMSVPLSLAQVEAVRDLGEGDR